MERRFGINCVEAGKNRRNMIDFGVRVFVWPAHTGSTKLLRVLTSRHEMMRSIGLHQQLEPPPPFGSLNFTSEKNLEKMKLKQTKNGVNHRLSPLLFCFVRRMSSRLPSTSKSQSQHSVVLFCNKNDDIADMPQADD